jgi:hypothetical protein
VFNVQEVLEIAREAKKATEEKTSCMRRCRGLISVEIEEDEKNTIENVSNDSD